jgi:hypothetical protein
MEIFQVHLRHGLADLPAFERAVTRIVSPGDGQIHVGSQAENTVSTTAGAIHLESVGLILFGVLAGLAAMLILGQALSRQVAADSAEHPTLAALGMSRRLDGPARARRRRVGGGVLAVVTRSLSPLTPIGLARRAEIDPGVSIDVVALGLGFVGVVALTVGWASCGVRADGGAPTRGARQRDPAAYRRCVAGLGLGPAAADSACRRAAARLRCARSRRSSR